MSDVPLHLVAGGRSWPREFEQVPTPPSEVWIRGNVDLLSHPRRLAIVGSRSASGYGLDQARHFAAELAQAGFTIVSGMARGVDQAAHQGALDVGGKTIAVLGNGVDRPWPNFDGLPQLLEHGLLLSEYAPGQAPRRHHFPLRNRLIATLSEAVLVVEAAHASGSLITAHWALEIGREVFALPGRVDHPMAAGTLRLLREGARAVGSPKQLLDDLAWEAPAPQAVHRQGEGPGNHAPDLEDPQAVSLWRSLHGESLTVDEIAQRVEQSLPQLLARLAQWQLEGWIARGPGGLYRRMPNA